MLQMKKKMNFRLALFKRINNFQLKLNFDREYSVFDIRYMNTYIRRHRTYIHMNDLLTLLTSVESDHLRLAIFSTHSLKPRKFTTYSPFA